MNYIDRIRELCPDDYLVTDELTYEYKGGTAVIVKFLSGQVYKYNTFIPIQFVIYTDDLVNTKTFFDNFTRQFSNNGYFDGLDYIKEVYSTPMVIENFNPMLDNYYSQILISGTLIVARDISDIKQVFIDGEEIEATNKIITYVANMDNQRVSNQSLNKSDVLNGMVKFTCNTINKNNSLGNKLRRIRQGNLPINTTFKIKLVFSDNETEELYDMKHDNHSIVGTNDTLPVLALEFIL